MNKHNYPKNRKTRTTEYSMTHKILKEIGKENLYEIWKKNGHRKTAKIISEFMDAYVSVMVIQYIAARKFKWQREVSDRSLSIYKGYLNGKISADQYKTIKFI